MFKRHVWERWWRYKRYLSVATLPAHQINCPCCGVEVALPSLHQTQSADCPQCGQNLVKIQANPFIAPLALVSAAWILMLLVSTQFYLGMDMGSVSEHLSLLDVFANLRRHEYGFLATVMLLLVFLTPVLFMSIFMYVHIALYTQRQLPGLNVLTRHMLRLKPWLMVDVFFIATLVAIVKISAISEVSFGPAFGLIFAYAALLIHMGRMVDPHWLFYQLAKLDPEHDVFAQHHAHQHDGVSCTRCLYYQDAHQKECDVCGATLAHRRLFSIQHSLAFLVAAMILFVPSNLYTMMRTDSLKGNIASNVIDGVIILWNDQDRLVASIIFVASLLIPISKIILMGVLLYSAKFKLLLSASSLSKIHHFVEFIGRWSMIDIFVIIILMAVYRTNLAAVTPGTASIFFTFVVFATMMSAELLDIRLIWDKQRQQDAAGEHQHE